LREIANAAVFGRRLALLVKRHYQQAREAAGEDEWAGEGAILSAEKGGGSGDNKTHSHQADLAGIGILALDHAAESFREGSQHGGKRFLRINMSQEGAFCT
jgi:hypothetical protein